MGGMRVKGDSVFLEPLNATYPPHAIARAVNELAGTGPPSQFAIALATQVAETMFEHRALGPKLGPEMFAKHVINQLAGNESVQRLISRACSVPVAGMRPVYERIIDQCLRHEIITNLVMEYIVRIGRERKVRVMQHEPDPSKTVASYIHFDEDGNRNWDASPDSPPVTQSMCFDLQALAAQTMVRPPPMPTAPTPAPTPAPPPVPSVVVAPALQVATPAPALPPPPDGYMWAVVNGQLCQVPTGATQPSDEVALRRRERAAARAKRASRPSPEVVERSRHLSRWGFVAMVILCAAGLAIYAIRNPSVVRPKRVTKEVATAASTATAKLPLIDPMVKKQEALKAERLRKAKQDDERERKSELAEVRELLGDEDFLDSTDEVKPVRSRPRRQATTPAPSIMRAAQITTTPAARLPLSGTYDQCVKDAVQMHFPEADARDYCANKR